MAYTLGDLVYRILGDSSQFDRSINKTKQEAERASGSVGKSLDLIKIKTLAMGVASTAVFVKTIQFLGDSAKKAIEAQETFSKFDVVFSGMGSAAENAADRFQKSFDLAEVTAKRMLSSTGDLLTGLGMTKGAALDMSVQVNELASDLASFTNYSGGAEGASAALTKALLGERESIKSLGIVIREEDVQQRLALAGKKNLTGAALLQAKAAVTLQIAMEQSKNAIGDYARTSESAANSLKRAKEATTELQVQIGSALSPSVAYLGRLWANVATSLAEVIRSSADLKNANKAIAEGTASTDQYLLSLREQRDELNQLINTYAQYDAAGELMVSASYEEVQQEIKSIDEQIRKYEQLKLVELRRGESKAQQTKEEEALARAREEREKKEAEKQEYLKSIDDKRADILKEYLATTTELNWRVEQGLMSEKDEREALAKAAEEQISSLYALFRETGDISIIMSDQMIDAINNLKDFQDRAADPKPMIDFEANVRYGIQSASELFAALGSLISAVYASKQEQLDLDLERELEANGVSEESAVQKAEREIEVAKKKGDKEAEDKARAELKKAQIEEKYAKKKAELEYEGAVMVWDFQRLQTIAGGILAVMNAFAAGSKFGPYVAAAYAATAGVISAVQIAAVESAKPIKKFATGGIVEPNGGGAVVRVAENNSGEVLFNTGETGQQFAQQMAGYIAQQMGGQTIEIVNEIDGDALTRAILPKMQSGQYRVRWDE